jgi:ubiquinone/menaquinone biosynthesis C-methylase UbiE
MKPAENPYYRSGTYLRAKHQQARLASGRDFAAWALSLLALPASPRLLDAGCGWGRFTWPLIETYAISPARLVAMDRSAGMLRTLLDEAERREIAVPVCAGDIEQLPFPAEAFDLVLANHVLYDVPDLARGVRELERVTRRDGCLLATTNSELVRVTIIELHYQALDALGVQYEPEPPSPFSMENGREQLRRGFRNVEAFIFEDSSVYPDADTFVEQYMTTGRYRNMLLREDVPAEKKAALPRVYRALVQDIIDQEGRLVVPVLMGAFVCTQPKQAPAEETAA